MFSDVLACSGLVCNFFFSFLVCLGRPELYCELIHRLLSILIFISCRKMSVFILLDIVREFNMEYEYCVVTDSVNLMLRHRKMSELCKNQALRPKPMREILVMYA